MSGAKKLLQAAAGGAGDPIYVDELFAPTLYTGNNDTNNIVNGIDLDGEGGAVYIKSADNNSGESFYDTERGIGKFLTLSSSGSTEGTTSSSSHGLKAFNDDGFTMGTNYTTCNFDGYPYISWTFRKQAKFFDIVTYTGNGSNRTISHDLGSVPGCIIVCRRDAGSEMYVYHRGLNGGSSPQNYRIALTENDAESSESDVWNNTAPTSTVFSVGTDNYVNQSSGTYVAYLFGHDEESFGENLNEAIIDCGYFSADGNGDATITLGWEPQFLLLKRRDSSSSGDWMIFDDRREWRGYDGSLNSKVIDVNNGNTSGQTNFKLDKSSTGFKSEELVNSGDYIYIAIRRSHKPPSAGTDICVPRIAQTDDEPGFKTTMYTDFAILKNVNSPNTPQLLDRMLGTNMLVPSTTAVVENNNLLGVWDYPNGITDYDSADANKKAFAFKRAKHCIDVVTYEGTGSNRTVTHHLGKAPELMWIKNTDQADSWAVYYGDNTDYLQLDLNTATTDDATYWNDTSPTSSVFTVGTAHNVNASGEVYVAYLFASYDGVIKVGSYTGTGSNVDVDCGFSSGARFVVIKRTDSTGSYFVYDSVGGIVAGNDPYWGLDVSAVTTNTDYIDPLSSGFTINSSAPADLNASSGNYIFLAIA